MIETQTLWLWQPALYLFLSGAGAGSALVSALLVFINYKRNVKTAAATLFVSLGCLTIGLVLLITELLNPWRAFILWESFSNAASTMTWGAWLLVADMIVFAIASVLFFFRRTSLVHRFWRVLPCSRKVGIRTLCVIVMVPAAGTISYTGFLLMHATGIPFWNTGFLPALFIVSALGSGTSIFGIVSLFTERTHAFKHTRRALSVATIVIVTLENIVLALLLSFAGTGYETLLASGTASSSQLAAAQAAQFSAEILLQGNYAEVFWIMCCLVGLIAPLMLSIINLAVSRTRRGMTMMALSCLCALLGECTLRFCIVYAGAHADYLAQTLLSIL